jgi:hypothetical protein
MASTGAGGEPKLASFAVPTVHFNADGWGPSSPPERYEKVPFAAFSKNDRLGKAADFGGYMRFQHRTYCRGGRCWEWRV